MIGSKYGPTGIKKWKFLVYLNHSCKKQDNLYSQLFTNINLENKTKQNKTNKQTNKKPVRRVFSLHTIWLLASILDRSTFVLFIMIKHCASSSHRLSTADSALLHQLSTAESTLLHQISTAESTLLHLLSTAESTLLHQISTAEST